MSARGIVFSVLGFALLRCGASGSLAGDQGSGDSESGISPGRDESTLTLGAPNIDGGEEKRNLHPLCGQGLCVPDNAFACDMGQGGAGGEGAGGAGGGVSFDPGDLDGLGMSCQVLGPEDCEGGDCGVSRACAPSGASMVDEPCSATSDCVSGLACVGEGLSGVCRPYCCEGTAASCGQGTFCDERPLPESPEIYVPVCIVVDNCSLTDPYPCPDAQECGCSDGKACTVVRPDGATACTVPGPGQVGDPCTGKESAECAHGFVCSPAAGACMKLCSITAEESECLDGGTCQSAADLPADLGVCVGSASGPSVAK